MHVMRRIDIDPDIRRARTLPSAVYHSAEWYAEQRAHLFPRTWHFIGDTRGLDAPGTLHPLTLLDRCVDEPMLLVRDGTNTLRCLSNVCTHRGNILVEHPCTDARVMRCRYHGRRFDLDGRMLSMPEFEGVHDFPSATDNLRALPLAEWNGFLFSSIDARTPFADIIAPVTERIDFLPLDRMRLDPATSRDYIIHANWALYCDNYLEGFHIPYIHEGLNEVIDYSGYRTELFPHVSLQVGIAREGDDAFDLPRTHPQYGENVAAFYFFLFPATMLNVYPWGISLNAVRPLASDDTCVSFLSYVWAQEKRASGAGGDLHSVELEDEAVVQSVQRGVRSHSYDRGRYSPKREKGVHHFHRLIAEYLG
jgi:choline monooxygenase